MSFWGGLVNDVKNFFGGNNQPKKNPNDQPQQQPSAPAMVFRPGGQGSAQSDNTDFLPQNRLNPGKLLNLTNLNPNVLQKVAPNLPTAPTTTPESTQPPDSIIHDLTHNPVTDFAGSIVKPTIEMGHALTQVPKAIYREVQNKPITDIQQSVYGTSDSGQLAKKIIGDTVNTGLLAAAPGVDGAALKATEIGAAALRPEAANTAVQLAKLGLNQASKTGFDDASGQLLTKIAPKVLSGTALGATGSANSAFSNNASLPDILKAGAEGGAIGGLTGGVAGAIPLLSKVIRGKLSDTPTSSSVATAPEVAPGITNKNIPTPAPETDLSQVIKANMSSVAQNPQISPGIQAAYGKTGIQDPYNLLMHALAGNDKKSDVRSAVEQMTGSTDSGLINRLTKKITDAKTPEDVHAAINDETQMAQNPGRPVQAPQPPQVAPQIPEPAMTPQVSAEHPDAAKIVAANAPKPVEQPAPIEPQKIVPNAMNDHETTALTQLEKDSKTRILTPEEQNTRVALQQKANVIDQANNPQPVKGAEMAPNAPGIRAAKLKTLGDNIDAQSTQHEVLNNKGLTAAAKNTVGEMSDQQVIDKYEAGADFRGSADLAHGNASMQRLNEILNKDPSNVDAQRALDNVMAASEKGISNGGSVLSYAKEFYEGLTGPAKVSYMMRQVNKSRAAAGLQTIDNVEERSAIQANLAKFFSKDEQLKADLAAAQDTAKNNVDAAKTGGTKAITAEGNALQTTINDTKRQIAENTANLKRYSDTELLPPKVATQTKIGNLTRSMMLSSPTGRGNDIITTVIKAAHDLAMGNVSALGGKIANAMPGSSGKLDSTFFSPKALIKGTLEGTKDSRQRFAGNLNNMDASNMLKTDNAAVGKAGLVKATGGGVIGAINRKVGAFTELATDLSKGVETARIQQMATNEGKSIGLKGENLKSYTSNRTAAPSREMVESGKLLHDQVNNMQDNPLSSALQKLSNVAPEHLPVIGETVKNVTLPFSRWTGGQLWSNLVDNNVAVSFGRAVKAFATGDRQEALNQTSRTAVNTVGMATLGYKLAEAGLVTDKNAQGYSDDGAYVHIGGRYIPLGFFGSMAPGLILGVETHKTLTGADKSQNLAEKLSKAYVNSLVTTFKASGANSITGTSNPIFQSIFQGKSWGDTGKTALASAVSQSIPSGSSDVNAVLNNGLKIGGKTIVPDSLNPTHEASLTKVTDPNSKSGIAKDLESTLSNQVLNKIPFASQTLPRNPGVAAADIVDRTSRGNRDTGATIQKQVTAKTLADTQAANLKANIPDPTRTDKGYKFGDAIENRLENKKYDAAISGLQQKLAMEKAKPDTNTRNTDPIQKQIGEATTLKDGNYDPTVRDTYKKISNAEWRNLGDPNKDTYDPEKYKLLFNYDKGLASNKASGNTNDIGLPKYSVKENTAKQNLAAANKEATAAANLIKNSTLRSTTNLPRYTSSTLAPEKISDPNAKIPTIQQIPSSQLIKKRSVSVTAGP